MAMQHMAPLRKQFITKKNKEEGGGLETRPFSPPLFSKEINKNYSSSSSYLSRKKEKKINSFSFRMEEAWYKILFYSLGRERGKEEKKKESEFSVIPAKTKNYEN
eukprot:TRINITY_DN3091_c4_g1_i1.p1 TRINITY_DN3091_c4_g1~~TRINITY_DN3091_c4_g1_i1.p1  ORF type:complete len:105 (-),score=11.20 TRINITY_DN3091_c4_g1_i1:161-475(-)